MSKARMKDVLEGSPWLWISLACVAFLAFYAPHQVGLLVWTLCKISMGAFLGYWIDRSVFHDARPGDLAGDPVAQRGAKYRRAGLMAATIIASSLGL